MRPELKGHLTRAAGIVLAALAVCAPLAAQRPVAVRILADNDAFNFWMPPWDRPDQEYTSGVRGALEYDGRLGWWPWRRITLDSGVVTHRFALGQAIYTGRTQPSPNSLALYAPVVTRPNAGWLYVEAAQRDSTLRATNEFSFAIGVTGAPALGGEMQRLFHSLGPEYNRPVDWSRQLPFEPGFVARYTRGDLLRSFGTGAKYNAAVVSELSGAVGSILTEGSAGAGATGEAELFRVPGTAAPLRLQVGVNARARLVLRDEFLDGTLFRRSASVAKETFVLEQRASVALRWRQAAIIYRANQSSRQYKAQPNSAAWGTLETEWRFGK